MKLKNVLMAIMMVAYAAPAFAEDPYATLRDDSAWSNCGFIASTHFQGSGFLANHCSGLIAKQAQITYGKHKGEFWNDAYPKAMFIDASTQNLNDGSIKKGERIVYMTSSNGKFEWAYSDGKGSYNSSPASKRIAMNDIIRYLKEAKLKPDNVFKWGAAMDMYREQVRRETYHHE